MDKKEILQKLQTVGLNNKITNLESELNVYKNNYKQYHAKSKEMVAEYVRLNREKHALENELANLTTEYNSLKQTANYNQEIINSIPKFIIKLFSRNKLLLDKGK